MHIQIYIYTYIYMYIYLYIYIYTHIHTCSQLGVNKKLHTCFWTVRENWKTWREPSLTVRTSVTGAGTDALTTSPPGGRCVELHFHTHLLPFIFPHPSDSPSLSLSLYLPPSIIQTIPFLSPILRLHTFFPLMTKTFEFLV